MPNAADPAPVLVLRSARALLPAMDVRAANVPAETTFVCTFRRPVTSRHPGEVAFLEAVRVPTAEMQ
jgi:hypothetical protein